MLPTVVLRQPARPLVPAEKDRVVLVGTDLVQMDQAAGKIAREPVSPIYSPAGRHVSVDGGDFAGGLCGFHATARFGASGSGLPDDSGCHVLSRSESGRGGLCGHGAAGAAVRPGAGLNQMTSTSSDGSSIIILQFSLELNIDVAEQEVQAAINAAQTYLPADLPTPPIYSKTNPADTPILTLALTSDTIPLSQVEDLADTRLAQKISQLPGVGLVSISGGQKPAVRMQVNPTALSSYGINLEDVRTALQATSLESGERQFRRAAPGLSDRRERPAADQQGLHNRWSSPIATARRCCCRTWPQ